MNIILRRFFFIFLLLSAIGASAQVQNTVIDMEIIWNTEGVHPFVSSPISPSLHVAPSNGTVVINGTGQSFHYELTYTPDVDFFGEDYFEIFYFDITLKKMTFYVTVLPASVVAKRDYASTMQNTAVQIEVLANDYSSNGVFLLTGTPATNNGWVEYNANGSTITFHPTADFVGLTSFNYIVCDGAGTCDNGTVSVTVMGTEPVVHDTLTVFTKINQPQAILIPHSFNLTTNPANGVYDDSVNPSTYTPDLDFYGDDEITFEHNGEITTVLVKVLNAKENIFLFKDEYFTTTSESIEFNVLENDLYGEQTGCVSIGNAEHGTVTLGANKGDVIYTPDPNFEGVDQFTYTGHEGATCGSPEETATVYVHISNFAPSQSQFFMSTPKRTPLLIGYDLPVSSYQFSVVEPGANLGEVLYLPGQVDTTIYGKDISGYNLLIYIPYEEIDEGHDQFQIEYCALNTEGDCALSKTVKVEMDILNVGSGSEPLCFDDCVWAGDTNSDGTVNMEDLLPIGISMGDIGTPRSEAGSPVWYGQYAEDWNGPFNNPPVDLKHIDADGDSVVTALDTMAIHTFYGKTHALTPKVLPFYEHEIILAQDGGDIFAEPGDLIQIPMVLGTEEDPAIDVYGFTFPFEYNPDVFDPASVKINFSTDSWLSYNSPILYMTKNSLEGKLDAGYTRTSGISSSGFGRIGMLEFVVEDIIDGFRLGSSEQQIEIGGGTSTVMNSAGQVFGMRIGTVTIHIVTDKRHSKEEQLNPDLLKIGPNPANQFINIHLNGQQQFHQVVVRNMTGQTVFNLENIETNRTQLNVGNYETGLYFVSVMTDAGVISKKFEVVR